MGAAIISPGYKRCIGLRDTSQGQFRIFQSHDTGRIFGRSEDDKIIVHDGVSPGPISLCHKVFLAGLCMHEDHIHIAINTVPNGSAGAFRNDLHLNPRIFFQHREQDVEQA